MIPLPDPEATRGTPAHPDSYPEFPTGSTVMALYPDTSCFYRAEVVASPKDLQNSRVSPPESLVVTSVLKVSEMMPDGAIKVCPNVPFTI